MVKQKLPNYSFYKTIFQARYKPHLKFYELLMTAALKFDEYPHWKTDRLKVTLRDYDIRCSLTISHNSYSFDQDLNENDYQMKYIEKTLTILPEAIEISAYKRLGFRRKYLIPIEMIYSELVTLNFIKTFQYEQLKNLLPVKIDDFSFQLDCTDDKLKFHINFGPITKNQIPKFIEFNEENHLSPLTRGKDYRDIIEKYPRVAVFIDIDVYRDEENISTLEGVTFLNEADSRMQKLVQNFRDFLFTQKGV